MYVENLLREKGSDVVTVTPLATVTQVARIFREHRIGAVVVVNQDDTLRGVFSERDIIRGIDMKGPAALTLPLDTLLPRETQTVSPDTTVESAMALMTERRVRHLPVMSGAAIIGIISIGDLVKSKITETESEAEELRNYIASA